MKKHVSVRDLRYHFPRVERLLREGDEVHVTKRNKVIAKLVPAMGPAVDYAPLPDFAARMKKIFGKRVTRLTGPEIVSWDRGKY